MKRYLILADGSVFAGEAFGAATQTTGEVVFNTGMSGYQETITDQSYSGQIITFTYPLIGNAGINSDDFESLNPTANGVIVRDTARVVGNWRSAMSLDKFLKQKGIPGIKGIDTRRLTRIIREAGTMAGSIVDSPDEAAFVALRATQTPTDLVQQVATRTAYPVPGTGRRVVVVDFGLKHSILRELAKRNCNVTVVPPDTTAASIRFLHPQGVLLSNGPGDPRDMAAALPMIRDIEQDIPLFGICLGHQLFALANGAATFKMKYGHRGFNHPVREIATGRISFTSQNHGYAVDPDSLNDRELKITHEEINDQTVEGLKHLRYPAFSVQFHPDAAPGPHDATQVFDDFMQLMDSWHSREKEEPNA